MENAMLSLLQNRKSIRHFTGEAVSEEDLEIIFIPGTFETVYKEAGKLYINFFKLKVNPYGDDVTPKIDDLSIEAFIIEQLKS